jgi:hypothetical protein
MDSIRNLPIFTVAFILLPANIAKMRRCADGSIPVAPPWAT